MSDTPRVRLVEPVERERLRQVRLAALAYSVHLADVHARESTQAVSFWSNRAARGAAGIEMATFVAVGGDALPFVGVVDGFLSADGQTVEIGGMWVAPQVQRQGLGRALLVAVCDWAKARGAQHAALWVQTDNVPAGLLTSELDSRFQQAPKQPFPVVASNVRSSSASRNIRARSHRRSCGAWNSAYDLSLHVAGSRQPGSHRHRASGERQEHSR